MTIDDGGEKKKAEGECDDAPIIDCSLLQSVKGGCASESETLYDGLWVNFLRDED